MVVTSEILRGDDSSVCREGTVPLIEMDQVLHADEGLLGCMFQSIDINDSEVLYNVFAYLKANRADDHTGFLTPVKALVLLGSMQHVGTEVFDSNSRSYRYFESKTLMQGWRYSPTFSRMCVNMLVDKCRKAFQELANLLHIDFFQDDIIVLAGQDDKDNLIKVTDIAIQTLESHGFNIRRHKGIGVAHVWK